MRLDRYLSNSGLGSRKEVKVFIKKGRVTVNDKVIKSDSFAVKENSDVVMFDGEPVEYHEFYYVLLNKPQGYVSAVEDNVYPPVTDLIPEYDFAKLFPVGRLDVDTTGALLLTNDGPLAHKLISPKYHVDKTYYVETDKNIDSKLVKAFKEGIVLDGELTLPGDLIIIKDNQAELTIHQGKFHQVKRMFQQFGYKVMKLDRKEFAFLNHLDLELGEYRLLDDEEVTKLIELTNDK